MPTLDAFVAFDLGAESGRAMLALLDNDRIRLEEVHRFPNQMLSLPTGLHWNIQQLWAHLVEGLRKAGKRAQELGATLVSLGVDTWGVDYALLGKSGQVLSFPFGYRDPRNPPVCKKTLKRYGEKFIYDITGLQFLPFNTLYQLLAQNEAEPATLKHADKLLMVPDLMHYFFSGKAVNEETDASTTQMIDLRGKRPKWATGMLKKMGLPTHMLGKIVPAGSVIGTLRKELAAETGVAPIKVIAPGTHDTASAVAAVPVDTQRHPSWAYLSSGTWSLLGAEIDKPRLDEATRRAAFTNERGVGGKIRLLKNIAGLWLVQECRRDLQKRGQDLDYPTLTDLASKAEPFRTLVDPAHAPFMSPGGILGKIDAFAAKTKQPAPTSPGQYVRACLESLALTYRRTLDQLEQVIDRKVQVLHIVGGGGQNKLLNQMTADAIGRPVIVGPYEATAIGNALTQAMGAKRIKNLAHLRAVVRQSFDLETVHPGDTAAYQSQTDRFTSLCS